MTEETKRLTVNSLEYSFTNFSKAYKCPNADDCHEGDTCPTCDAYHQLIIEVEKTCFVLRGL